HVVQLYFLSLQANVNEVVLFVPWAFGILGGNRKRIVALGLWILIAEIIDHLLHPHGIGLWQASLCDVPANIAIRSLIHIDAESRQRIFFCILEFVVINLAILLRIKIAI